jgi:hypothetical protein
MPGFDGRGPRGMGSMTGWGRGVCGSRAGGYGSGLGFGRAGGFGRGFRRGGYGGFGPGRGFGWRAAPPAAQWGWGSTYGPAAGPYGVNPEDEAGYLKQEAEAVRRELEAIQQRIEELESRESSS